MLALVLAAALNVGEPAPPLTVELMRSPAGAAANWQALRGKAVVLEFWATWCNACVDAIPRWNALVSAFRDRPVEFIAISSDDEETLRAFLDRRPADGWIALDSSGATFDRYGVEAVPLTVLVDSNGIVRAITHPQHLAAAAIEQLLASGPLNLPGPSGPG